MEFSSTLKDSIAAKQLEIERRGLMGFPQDSELDRLAQLRLQAEISQIESFITYTSPTTGLKLPIDRQFPANMLYYFLIGDYEEHDMQLIARYVKKDSRVLELGGGIGLTGSLLALASGNPVTVCEPNPALHTHIERTFEANDAKLNLVKVAATADHETAVKIEFHIREDYWWSSLLSSAESAPVQVEARTLSRLIEDSRADTLLVDIEGYEVELLRDAQGLGSIETLLVELHTPSIGTAASSKIITDLVQCGFHLADFGGHTFVFTRKLPENEGVQPGPFRRWY